MSDRSSKAEVAGSLGQSREHCNQDRRLTGGGSICEVLSTSDICWEVDADTVV